MFEHGQNLSRKEDGGLRFLQSGYITVIVHACKISIIINRLSCYVTSLKYFIKIHSEAVVLLLCSMRSRKWRDCRPDRYRVHLSQLILRE